MAQIEIHIIPFNLPAGIIIIRLRSSKQTLDRWDRPVGFREVWYRHPSGLGPHLGA